MFRKISICGGIASAFLLAAIFFNPVFAADQIKEAETIEEYIEYTTPDLADPTFIVDKKTGKSEERTFESVFGEDLPQTEEKAKNEIEESGEYIVSGESENSFEITSLFSTKRLIISRPLDDLYGAKEGIIYEGQTLLKYETEEDTKRSFEMIKKELGEDKVFIDVPLKMYAKGWGTSYMNLDKKSEELKGTGSVTVAVLDTGINKNHSVFSGKTISNDSYSLVDSSTQITDKNGHGTMTAGIIAESTPQNVELMALKVMNSRGTGSMVTYTQGIQYALEKNVDVINCSLGGQIPQETANYMDKVLKKAENAGIIIVSASGNDGADMDETIYYPCESPYSMCVGAIDERGNICDFSNYGQAVDFCAPGESVAVALHDSTNSFYGYSGTSFSCPYISAAAALLKLEDKSISRSGAITKLKDISIDLS